MMLRFLVALAAALAMVAAGSPTALAEAVGFSQALDRALGQPEVVGASARLAERVDGDRALRGPTGNPTVTIMPGWRPAGVEERGAELQASIQQNLVLGGYGAARRRAARAERAALAKSVSAAALASRLEAARAWIELFTAERTAERLDEEIALLETWATAIDRAAELGSATRADAASVRAALADTRELRQRHAGLVAEAQVELARRIGATDAPDLVTTGPAPQPRLPAPTTLDQFDPHASPAVGVARLASAAAAARVREVAAGASTQLGVGAQIQADQPGAPGDSLAPRGFAAFAIVSITPPVFARADRARALARADAAGAAAEQTAAEQAAQALWHSCLRAQRAAQAALATLEEEVIPAHEAARQAWARRRELGAGTVFEELAARRAEVAARRRLVVARGEASWTRTRLALLWAAVANDAASEVPR